MLTPAARLVSNVSGRMARRTGRVAAVRDPFGATRCFAATRNPLRGRAAILATAAVAVLLTGCPRHPPPADVPFPDDPRVLNGAWQVQVTGLASRARDLVYAPAAGRLVAWFDEGPRTFELDENLGWREVAVAWGAAVFAGMYDPAIESFVEVDLAGADPRVRVTPIDGGPRSVAPVAMPAGHTLVSVARGSGRAFALTRDAGGSHHLTWWDAVSGAVGGTRHVGAVPDGMRASANGRVLALWDLRGYRVTVVDSVAPDRDRTLRLGVCRSNGLNEASSDGRWFLTVDCRGNLLLADLTAPERGSSALGIAQHGHVAFALDGADIVWRDRSGVIYALDAASRQRSELARLEGGASFDGFDAWSRVLVVHRATNVLAVITAGGTVHAAGLPGAAPPRPAADLPVLDLTGAALDLTVAPIDPEGADAYEFEGTFTPSRSGATDGAWPIAGRVFAHRLHRYLPTDPTVTPAVPPPPTLFATASAIDPETGAELFALDFSTTDRHATSFAGVLRDVTSGTWYRVRVERAIEDDRADGGPEVRDAARVRQQPARRTTSPTEPVPGRRSRS